MIMRGGKGTTYSWTQEKRERRVMNKRSVGVCRCRSCRRKRRRGRERGEQEEEEEGEEEEEEEEEERTMNE